MNLQFWNGRDNTEDLILLSDGIPEPADAVTRIVVDLGVTVVDSVDVPDAFEFPVDLTYKSGTTTSTVAGLRLALGGQLTAGTYSGWLVTYDPFHPDGVVWAALQIMVY